MTKINALFQVQVNWHKK